MSMVLRIFKIFILLFKIIFALGYISMNTHNCVCLLLYSIFLRAEVDITMEMRLVKNIGLNFVIYLNSFEFMWKMSECLSGNMSHIGQNGDNYQIYYFFWSLQSQQIGLKSIIPSIWYIYNSSNVLIPNSKEKHKGTIHKFTHSKLRISDLLYVKMYEYNFRKV